jgi:transcriptional regulator with XRE-family HTH domain
MRAEIGQRLKRCRIDAHLSLGAVAQRMGLSRQAVSAWEAGRNVCDCLQLATLAEMYGAPADYILFGVNTIPADLDRIMRRGATVP